MSRSERTALAAHVKEGHRRTPPGLYGLGELRRFHTWLHDHRPPVDGHTHKAE